MLTAVGSGGGGLGVLLSTHCGSAMRPVNHHRKADLRPNCSGALKGTLKRYPSCLMFFSKQKYLAALSDQFDQTLAILRRDRTDQRIIDRYLE